MNCKHCNQEIIIRSCLNCKRLFVLVESHKSGKIRQLDDFALLDKSFHYNICDFCLGDKFKLPLTKKMEAGLTQATCPKCRTECVSDFKDKV